MQNISSSRTYQELLLIRIQIVGLLLLLQTIYFYIRVTYNFVFDPYIIEYYTHGTTRYLKV